MLATAKARMFPAQKNMNMRRQVAITCLPAACAVRCRTRLSASAGPSVQTAGPRSLTAEEEASLQTYQASVGKAFSRGYCVTFLGEAAKSKNASPQMVEGALLALEQRMPDDKSGQPAVTGNWHLVFSTATKIRQFQYIPVYEELVIAALPGDIALQSVVGPFSFNIKGSSDAWEAGKGILQFQFTEVEIKFLGSKIWTVKPKTKPKTYTFFYVDDTISGARSSGGGITLLRRV